MRTRVIFRDDEDGRIHIAGDPVTGDPEIVLDGEPDGYVFQCYAEGGQWQQVFDRHGDAFNWPAGAYSERKVKTKSGHEFKERDPLPPEEELQALARVIGAVVARDRDHADAILEGREQAA
ncbi:hypothetical protein [Methylobacterium aquaticum]|uniref:Uncharacterized protein n=1 Tax=Methylobacterium aquaticum TaxID=270351 RepID=A0A0J6VEW3_9HYPH|nr:hypothetical protein [Methylobacterium aquaticum]KMO37581.1 hypothetical protein VP06_07885 [Methylobacterium aquaticum]